MLEGGEKGVPLNETHGNTHQFTYAAEVCLVFREREDCCIRWREKRDCLADWRQFSLIYLGSVGMGEHKSTDRSTPVIMEW